MIIFGSLVLRVFTSYVIQSESFYKLAFGEIAALFFFLNTFQNLGFEVSKTPLGFHCPSFSEQISAHPTPGALFQCTISGVRTVLGSLIPSVELFILFILLLEIFICVISTHTTVVQVLLFISPVWCWAVWPPWRIRRSSDRHQCWLASLSLVML